MRFTWEYVHPEYYVPGKNDNNEDPAIVVISNGSLEKLPEKIAEKVAMYRSARVYDASTGIFKYSPVVSVYLPPVAGE